MTISLRILFSSEINKQVTNILPNTNVNNYKLITFVSSHKKATIKLHLCDIKLGSFSSNLHNNPIKYNQLF